MAGHWERERRAGYSFSLIVQSARLLQYFSRKIWAKTRHLAEGAASEGDGEEPAKVTKTEEQVKPLIIDNQRRAMFSRPAIPIL